MITIKWHGEKRLYDSSVRLEQDMHRKAGNAVKLGAEMLAADIRENWSAKSPSPKGKPPAVVTGNLDSSVIPESVGRDVLGRFADKHNTTVHFVHINTKDGDNPGGRGNYTQVLEFELNRPFIRPAVARAQRGYKDLVKRELR